MGKLLAQLNTAMKYYDDKSMRYQRLYRKLKDEEKGKRAFQVSQQAIADIGIHNNEKDLLENVDRVRRSLYATADVETAKMFESMLPGVMGTRLQAIGATQQAQVEQAQLKAFRNLGTLNIVDGKVVPTTELIDQNTSPKARLAQWQTYSKNFASQGLGARGVGGGRIALRVTTKDQSGNEVNAEERIFMEKDGQWYDTKGTEDRSDDTRATPKEAATAQSTQAGLAEARRDAMLDDAKVRNYNSLIKSREDRAEIERKKLLKGAVDEITWGPATTRFADSRVKHYASMSKEDIQAIGGEIERTYKGQIANILAGLEHDKSRDYITQTGDQKIFEATTVDELGIEDDEIKADVKKYRDTATQYRAPLMSTGRRVGDAFLREIAKRGDVLDAEAQWDDIVEKVKASGTGATDAVRDEDYGKIKNWIMSYVENKKRQAAYDVFERVKDHPLAKTVVEKEPLIIWNEAANIYKQEQNAKNDAAKQSRKENRPGSVYYSSFDVGKKQNYDLGLTQPFYYLSDAKQAEYIRKALNNRVPPEFKDVVELKSESTQSDTLVVNQGFPVNAE